jgi:pimeloyl-ACP methyl ester carboxylesterase
MTAHRTLSVSGHEIFYREAGDPAAPTLLLLHGFPSSSFMYRRLISRLAGSAHLVAPDLPGFGHTQSPAEFGYTFESLSEVAEEFVGALGIDEFSLYVFDFGAPVGFRLATRRPDLVRGLVVQNGNAYEEGLSDEWAPIRAYWKDREADAVVSGLISHETTVHQYTAGTRDPQAVGPDGPAMDEHFLAQPGRAQVMADLFYDYQTNIQAYPTWQAWLRERRPPTLVAWGRNDPFFTVAGAEAFRRDVPDAQIHFLDTGHFALEEDDATIASLVGDFLASVR